MTNKLAIMDLKDIRDYLIECHYNVEALDYAIKALEQMELIKFNIHALRELMKEAENE